MKWRIDYSLSLDAALSVWQRQAAINKRPRTVEYHADLLRIVRLHWKDALAKPCREITADDVATFAERVGFYSGSTFNALVNLVRAVVPDSGWLRRRKVQPKIVDLPDHEGFERVLAELDRGLSPTAGLVVRLLAFTGLRIAEAQSLMWSDVLPRGLRVRDSKTHKARLIPWVGEARQVVENLRPLAKGSPFIVNVVTVRKALMGACKRAGVPYLTHHDFRRLFATRAIESGVDLPTASRWLGHQDGGALLGRTYFHLLDGHSIQMAARVEIRRPTVTAFAE